MTLAAALANATQPNVRRTRLDEIWDQLDEDDRTFLLQALRDPNVKHQDLSAALETLGHYIHRTTIGEARRVGWANHKETS